MKRRSQLILLAAISTLAALLVAQSASHTQAMYDSAARSAERKFAHIEQNGRRAHPDSTPTVLTENEVNAWFSSGQADLPKGMNKLRLEANPGTLHASANVDFDQITAGRYSGNPLMSLFSGTHQVEGDAHAEGSNGTGQVHIDSVSIDGVPVPRMALEYFVDHYIHPKYPDLGIDSTFQLPDKISEAQVGSHQVTVVQR